MRWSKEHERSCTWRWTGRWPTGRWPCRSGRERFRWRRRSISWFMKMFDDFHLMNMGISKIGKCCWWKKSCTTRHVWYPVNKGLFTISTGAGFLPSTVSISSLLITCRNLIQKPPFFCTETESGSNQLVFFWGICSPRKSESMGNTIWSNMVIFRHGLASVRLSWLSCASVQRAQLEETSKFQIRRADVFHADRLRNARSLSFYWLDRDVIQLDPVSSYPLQE